MSAFVSNILKLEDVVILTFRVTFGKPYPLRTGTSAPLPPVLIINYLETSFLVT